MTETIPMSGPDITRDEITAVENVLRTPFLSIGPQIAQFEARFAEYVGASHAAAVSSGTAGLHLACIAAGVTEGDLIADRITVADRITELAEVVAGRPQLTFRELLPKDFELFDVVITFLAILEMTRLKMIRLVQSGTDAEILVMAAPRYEDEEDAEEQHDG